MKRIAALFLTFAMCFGLLTACGKDVIPTEDVELWVVMELTDQYGMNLQAEKMIERFNELYPNVTVKLDILPIDEEERAVYMQKLRTQIMAGAGPDAYLMSTQNTVPDPESPHGGHKFVDALFWNVELAMYNGLFCDISEFYDADETLEKEALNTSVMDGGLMDGGRYVLPLRYDFGVYFVDQENLEATGLDVSILEGSHDDVIRTILATGDCRLANGYGPTFPDCYFSDHVDLDSCSVTLNAEELSEYLKLYQEIKVFGELDEDGFSNTVAGYVWGNDYFASEGYGLSTGRLSTAVSIVAAGKLMGEDIEMYPQLAADGTLHAVVRYYAAVAAGAEYPRLAYEFIKLFLSEEAQYETYLGKTRATTAITGYPVRTVGSVESQLTLLCELLDNNKINRYWPVQDKRKTKFLESGITLTDSDVPAVSWQVDRVLFPLTMDYEDSLICCINALLDFGETSGKYTAADVDFDALAQGYIDSLQFYLDER